MRSRRVLWASVGSLLVLSLLWLNSPAVWGLGRSAFYLAFGWIGFVAQTVPRARMDIRAIVVGLAALTLFGIGMHGLLRRLLRPSVIRVGDGFVESTSAVAEWKARRSVVATAGVIVLFFAGLCAIGLQRQVTWAVTSPGPEWTYFGQGTSIDGMYRSSAKGNLKAFGLAFHNYHDVHQTLPPGGVFDSLGRGQHGWLTLLLPYFELGPLYEQVRFDRPWHHVVNKPPLSTHVPLFTCPLQPPSFYHDERGYGLSHHAANARLFGRGAIRIRDIMDGTSNTVFCGEVKARFRPWGHPANWRDPAAGINQSPEGFGSPFPGGCLFLLGDGTVRFVNENIDPRVLKAIATPNGGETVSDF